MEHSQEQGGTEAKEKGLTEHWQGRNPVSGDVCGFQTPGGHLLQMICNQVCIKNAA